MGVAPKKKREKRREENPKVCKGNTDMFKNCLQVVVLVCRKSKTTIQDLDLPLTGRTILKHRNIFFIIYAHRLANIFLPKELFKVCFFWFTVRCFYLTSGYWTECFFFNGQKNALCPISRWGRLWLYRSLWEDESTLTWGVSLYLC